MSKKVAAQSGANGWKYSCNCGFSTLEIGSAVGHVNKNQEHQLQRSEL